MINEALKLLLVFSVGLSLGSIFYGGLYFTVKHGMLSQRPALWFLGSLLLRMSLVLTGFYFISNGQWQRLLACLLGFIVMRTVVQLLIKAVNTKTTNSDASNKNTIISDTSHHAT
jgi:F1F0 ATPase subunit 2